MNADLIERRERLVVTLRARVLPKGTGSLCVRVEEFNEETEESQYRTEGYCCIGVGLKIETELNDDELATDDSDDYEAFKDIYEVTEKTKDYLVAMNDGDPRHAGSEFREIRDHPFIARFLEIIWALENNKKEN